MLVGLVIYGVYYLIAQSSFIELISIPRIFSPFATSSPPVALNRRAETPRAEAPIVPTPTPPQGFALHDLSALFKKVRIVSVERPNQYGIGGSFTVQVESAIGSAVDVTGWEVRSNHGSIAIESAYAPAGPVNQTRIVIRPATSAVFYAAWSSFVKNIELNICTGYLNGTYALSPKLPNNCPRPARSEIVRFSGACQNFINSLSSCEVPTPSELNQYAVSGDTACRAFIDTLTYEGCVKRYGTLSNFYSYGWRAWLGTELKFDRYHDRLLLFDEGSKLVDEYVY